MKLEIGKKYTATSWERDQWLTVERISHDKESFWAVNENGEESFWLSEGNWIPYKEPKPEVKINKYLGAVVRDKLTKSIHCLTQINPSNPLLVCGVQLYNYKAESEIEEGFDILKMPLWITDE